MLLAEALPATSRATGRNEIYGYFDGNNFDLMSFINSISEFPQERKTADFPAGRWLHGDFRDVAYIYLSGLYHDMVSKGGL